MAKSKTDSTEEILVKVDQNNLIYIDPNSVIKDGTIESRGLNQENLVMYLNLEADLVPRTILSSENDKSTLTSIAKGKLNFLRNQTGDGNFDTSWTDTYVNSPELNKSNDNLIKDQKTRQLFENDYSSNDKSGQSFGIESVNIKIEGYNAIPRVEINFIDVRGKTLFESPENSPYKAFFHIPWPIFYLSVKGYYGKAIRYRLHLVKFTTKYNESNGNFESSATFVGSTYAYLSDIPLQGMLNAPYMFPIPSTKTKLTNTSTGQSTEEVEYTTRGYSMLKTIYQEYAQKGLISKDFPIKTLREVITASHAIDKILEKEIYDYVDMNLFAGLKEFEETIDDFVLAVRAWSRTNLVNVKADISTEQDTYYGLKENITSTDKIYGTEEKTLEFVINRYKEKINKSKVLSENLINKTKSRFDKKTLSIGNVGDIKDYVYTPNSVYVKIDKLVDDIYDIQRNFEEQRKTLENDVETKMNEIVRRNDGKGGFGFEPTIRNVFAILLANAETYIRLMIDVHRRAFDIGEERKKILFGFTDESVGDPIYPWPEIKINSDGKENVIVYPGDKTMIRKLQSDNPQLWPEVEFIENYIGVTTNRLETLAKKEEISGNFENSFNTKIDLDKVKPINLLGNLSGYLPYTDKIESNFLYEIWERAYTTTLLNSFNYTSIQELADKEFENIRENTTEEISLIRFLNSLSGTTNEFKEILYRIAPFEKYSYYVDNIPTTSYISDFYVKSHKIEKYTNTVSKDDNSLYPKLQSNLIGYKSEEYRKNIFPFTSDLYSQYLNNDDKSVSGFTKQDLEFNGELQVNTKEGFISSPINPQFWVNDLYKDNIFSQRLSIDNVTSSHILNTPYFHKQLYGEFHSEKPSFGKYVGSAYLLLNSLPFVELSEMVNFGISSKRPSVLFKEIGASHYIPYHLMLKWGSIYHRYKKYLIDEEDILGYFVISGKTTPINKNDFFGSSQISDVSISAVTINGNTITDSSKDVGINPYYQARYHEIVNGYNHYTLTGKSISFTNNVNAGGIVCRKRTPGNNESINYWTSFVDNSKYVGNIQMYTILPSDGSNLYIDKIETGNGEKINQDTMTKGNQIYFRSLWEDTYVNSKFEEINFPDTTTSMNNDTDYFGITNNNRKVIDLIGTFSPSILEDFENEFLNFASEVETLVTPKKTEYQYQTFQDLLKELVTVEKKTSDSSLTIDNLINVIRERQIEKLKVATKNILSESNLVKLTIGNPKEIDPHVFHGFADINTVNKFTTEKYSDTDLTTENINLIKLYIGEEPTTNCYVNFFVVNNIKITEENIRLFRPLVLIYAGYIKAGGTNTTTAFKTYIKDNIFIKNSDINSGIGGSENRLNIFLDRLLPKLKELKYSENINRISINDGNETKPLKTELYNSFKSFNDKWCGGNSIGQRNLLEEFLFLDRANKDIGDQYFFNLTRLKDLEDEKNVKMSLYSVLSSLLSGTGFEMRPLPSYVNYYGTNFSSTKTKITPSKKVAENLFGTFLDVDYQESSPKIIIQYISAVSKRPDMPDKKTYRFTDDSFNIGNTNKNPMLYTLPKVFKTGDLAKSNRVVAFEVSFGDQNQNIFKGIKLDQATLKNTTESFVVLENLGKTESGSSAYNVDIGLYEYYRQASYQCEVSCMGNVMIQPTMFFYLKNVPMFKGTYWITEVNHSIRNNVINTTFKGTRIPYTSLPDPKDSFVSSYKVLFDKLTQRAISRVNGRDKVTTTSQVIKTNEGSFTLDKGTIIVPNETLIETAGFTEFGIPYNGYGENGEGRYIQKVEHPTGTWLRANVVKMGGPNFSISETTSMQLISKLKDEVTPDKPNMSVLYWLDTKKRNEIDNFYSTNFDLTKVSVDKLFKNTTSTTFYNPIDKKGPFVIEHNFKVSKEDYNNIPQTINLNGPIDIGPNMEGKGIALSGALMKKLGVKDGDVVYFWVNYK